MTKQKQHGPHGVYYEQSFKVVLSVGLTELKAHISWIEKVSVVHLLAMLVLTYADPQQGVEKRYVDYTFVPRGPAKIVYDDDAIAC